MAEKVKLSKDGSSIDFVQTDNIPTSLKKFRQSPEIEGFYRFIFENDLRAEGAEILDRIIHRRVCVRVLSRRMVSDATPSAGTGSSGDGLRAGILDDQLGRRVVGNPARRLVCALGSEEATNWAR